MLCGLFFGVLIEGEVELVVLIVDCVCFGEIWLIECVCLVFIGIEVIMMVICFVCGVIGCDLFVKFVGYYYGYFDGLFVEVGLGVVILVFFGLVGVFVLIVV